MPDYDAIRGPPDLLQIRVLEAAPGRPDRRRDDLIRPDGKISLGFYGDLDVAGLTLTEVKKKLVLHMAKFLSDETLGLVTCDEHGKPHPNKPEDSDRVSVNIVAFNSKAFYVDGEVKHPGRFAWTGNETVLDALHWAEGLTPEAAKDQVKLLRPSETPRTPARVLPVDYDQIMMGQDLTTNYRIWPGDRLVVPRRSNVTSSVSDPPSANPAPRARAAPLLRQIPSPWGERSTSIGPFRNRTDRRLRPSMTA